jgi:hypothetical protein
MYQITNSCCNISNLNFEFDDNAVLETLLVKVKAHILAIPEFSSIHKRRKSNIRNGVAMCISRQLVHKARVSQIRVYRPRACTISENFYLTHTLTPTHRIL